MGAQPTLYAATQDLPGNSYVGPDGRFELRGLPGAGRPQRRGQRRGDGTRSCGRTRSGSPASRSRWLYRPACEQVDRRRVARASGPQVRHNRRQQRDRAGGREGARGQGRPRGAGRPRQRQGRAGRTQDRRRHRGALPRPRRSRLDPRLRAGRRGRDRRPDQQRGRDEHAARPHRRRLRAAVRHQPPRALRAHEPAAAADHATASWSSPPAPTAPPRSTSTTSTPSAATSGYRAYGQTKLANLLFASELQRRLDDGGLARSAPSRAHPGWAATNLQKPHRQPARGRADRDRRATAVRPERATWARCPRSTPRRRTSPATATSAPTAGRDARPPDAGRPQQAAAEDAGRRASCGSDSER